MEVAGHRPYRLGVIELGLGFLVSSLAIPSTDIESRVTLSLTIGTAIGGLFFYVGPFERFVLPKGLRTMAKMRRDYAKLLSTSYMANSVAYVVGGWYACVAIALVALFPPPSVARYMPIEPYRFSLAVVVALVFVASILEFNSIPMKLRLIAHYESLIRYSRDPGLLEQTFGAALARGDFLGDAEIWSRRWTLGEEYVRIRPILLEAHKILAEVYSCIMLREYTDPLPELKRFRVFLEDRIKRTQLDSDFLTGGYSELLRDFTEIAKTAWDLEEGVAKNKDTPHVLKDLVKAALSEKFQTQIKRATQEIGKLIEDEMWQDLTLGRRWG